MSHKPIFLQNLSFSVHHKTCFEQFNATIHPGAKIGIMGPNGGGKSTLLKIIQGLIEPTDGCVVVSPETIFGYVPQIVKDFYTLSGGQRFNKALTTALQADPEILCLDEPTNHLDRSNRQSLMRMLRNFSGTLILVSHDVELLRTCVDTLWHIDEGIVTAFSGGYDNYWASMQSQRATLESQLSVLKRKQKKTHERLMHEQERAKNRKIQGEKRYAGEKMALRAAQGSGQWTMNRNKSRLSDEKKDILEQLANMRLPEVIKPKFSLTAADIGSGAVVSISEGVCGYVEPVLHGISLLIGSHERIALMGDNGSGKSTLVKAILGDVTVHRLGDWFTPKKCDIGYLDQHYANVDDEKTVLDTIHELLPGRSHAEVRSFLNDFLFRKNEEVQALVGTLSGGEKVRLSFACIAAKTPWLLILDEITNNLDLETREHVIQVLSEYPGTLIVISHDEDFLERIGITLRYRVNGGK